MGVVMSRMAQFAAGGQDGRSAYIMCKETHTQLDRTFGNRLPSNFIH
jgi:hypothetical protein